MKTQPCVIIPPGRYDKISFDSDKCYVCNGNIRLHQCHFSSKLYVIGNLISKRSIFKDVDVNGISILKDSVCDELVSFSGGNIFRSNGKQIITHNKTFLKSMSCDSIQVHGKLKISGICEISQIKSFS